MKKVLLKIFNNPFWLILVTVIIKLPLFWTKNIQEDAFITWRVARNLLHYGVIGFNGDERISASTTHLYVLISAFFQLIFGENFIYPLLIFSGILFAVGSFWLAKILFPADVFKRGFFVVFLNMVPPALTASGLGMEYGLLFFLYTSLLYFGIFHRKNWAYFIFPVLLVWTRIDAVSFLGVFFAADLVIRKKISYAFILGGVAGLMSVVLFNYLYFGELVNHTITAKKIAYKSILQKNSLEHFLYQWAYYGGLIKKYSVTTFIIFFGFLVFLGFSIFKIVKDKSIGFPARIILIAVFVFALLKISVFAWFKAYFDWYYWLPRVFLFAIVLFYVFHFIKLRKGLLFSLVAIVVFGLYTFQLLQSYTIGYMEERQRMQIAADINTDQVTIKQSILLEPAGIIPFYTNLFTYDEVGLVNKKITAEMLNDEKFWWINSVKRFRPDYILTIAEKPGLYSRFYRLKAVDTVQFEKDYQLVKVYPIAKIHNNAPYILRCIYKIRPIGKDYYLYKPVHKAPLND